MIVLNAIATAIRPPFTPIRPEATRVDLAFRPLGAQDRPELPRTVEGLTRDEACVRFQPKIALLARKVQSRVPPHALLQVEDLVSVGAIGLFDAFDRFDSSRGIRFTTYAEHRVRGAMIDALRSDDSLSRTRRSLARRVERTHEALVQETGRQPTACELADRLGMSLEAFHASIDAVQQVHHASLEDAADGGRPLCEVTPATDPLPGDALEASELLELLLEGIAALPERERRCVEQYYLEERLLTELAEDLGVTPTRVSQILAAARDRLRRALRHVGRM